MRFYRHCSCLTIHLDPDQMEEKLGQHCLTELWRHRIRDTVTIFYGESKCMRMSGSRLRLECKKLKYKVFETSVWELITDDDMIIFDRCINMYKTAWKRLDCVVSSGHNSMKPGSVEGLPPRWHFVDVATNRRGCALT